MQENKQIKYEKYKFRLLEILETTYTKAEITEQKKQICKKLDISASRLDAICYAKQNSSLNIPSDKFIKLCNYLDISCEYLYNTIEPVSQKNYNLSK